MEPKYKVNPLTGELQEYVFEYNGILALRNFTARVEDERLILHAADDVNFSILEALVSEVEINGVVYDNPTAAQEALTRLTFNQNRPVLLDKTLKELILGAVQKVEGKGLSSNDFTNAYKQQLDALEDYDIELDESTTELKFKKGNNVVRRISLMFLDDEGTKLVYNKVNKNLELRDKRDNLLTSIPVSHFVSNIPTNIVVQNGKIKLMSGSEVIDENAISYNDLADKPNLNFAPANHTHYWDDIGGKPNNLATTENVKTAIEGIQIGGKNLLRRSNTIISNNEYLFASYQITEDIKPGDVLTLSIDSTLAEGCKVQIFAKDGDGNYGFLTEGVNTFDSVRGYTIPKWTYVNLYMMGNNTKSKTNTIRKIKLERGNIATMWSPAPEDLIDDITIGCRNLALNTKNWGEINVNSTSPINITRVNDIFPNLQIGVVYKVSFDAKTTANGEVPIHFEFHGGGAGLPDNGNVTISGITYKRYSAYIRWNDNKNFYVWLQKAGNNVTIKNIKIYIGTQTEDWTPAPEDVIPVPRSGAAISTNWTALVEHQNNTIFVENSLNIELGQLQNMGSISFIKTFDGGNVTFTCSGKTIKYPFDNQFNGKDGSTAVATIYVNKCYIRISNI